MLAAGQAEEGEVYNAMFCQGKKNAFFHLGFHQAIYSFHKLSVQIGINQGPNPEDLTVIQVCQLFHRLQWDFAWKKVSNRSSGIDSGMCYVDIANLNSVFPHKSHPFILGSCKVPQIWPASVSHLLGALLPCRWCPGMLRSIASVFSGSILSQTRGRSSSVGVSGAELV